MGRVFRNGDHILLGHAPRDPFAGTPSGFPPAYIDVDFSDVFGGPPRRSSGHETRGGLSDGGRRVGGEAARGPCRPCSCSFGEEMPVFGGGGSPASSHRRQLGDYFFDDVFKGNNGSPCYSPRKMVRDPLASTPGSRVLSPARPLPPTSDVFSGGSSRPAKLSFSTRPAKGSDRLEFSSPTPDVLYKNDKSIPGAFSFPSPIANAPTNLSRLLQTKDHSKCDTCASFNGSTLHHQTPHSKYRSSEGTRLACSETNDTDKQFKNDTSGLQAYSGSDYFHFSIYKWANIGVTLVMPYNLNERIKSGIKVNGVSTQISQVEDLLPENQSTLQGCRAFQNQTDLEDKCQLNDLAAAKNHDISMTKEVKEVLPASPVTKSIQSDITDAAVGDKEITGQIANKESMVKDYTMKDANDTATLVHKTGENMFSRHTEKAMLKMHDTSATMEANMHGRRAKGKVKEFIKIFNQEHAPRSGSTVENRAGKCRIVNEVKGRQETCLSARVANTDENEKLKVEDVALSTPAAANQNLGISEENMQKIEDSSPEVKSLSDLLSDSTLDILDAPVCNIEEAYIENIDKCLVEELPLNQNEVTGTALHWEEVRTADAKIREWSKGKEGNIRSLLSTLQYVLWPGSGWKPIPLVDIIEGVSVRRAYQKALLCLHPDKLLQKGVEIHQKYIAEKVFDILQEAWTQFNSVSSL